MFKILLIILLPLSALCQTFEGHKVTFRGDRFNFEAEVKDTLSTSQVKAFFTHIDNVLPSTAKHADRYLYTANATYYRAGIGVFRKPKIYVKENNSWRAI